MSKEDWVYLNVPKDTKERLRYLSLALKKPQGKVMDEQHDCFRRSTNCQICRSRRRPN